MSSPHALCPLPSGWALSLDVAEEGWIPVPSLVLVGTHGDDEVRAVVSGPESSTWTHFRRAAIEVALGAWRVVDARATAELFALDRN